MAALPLVLVVDDYADARAMYAAWLQVSGYRVVEASTAADALAFACAEPPAAILMDLSLPGLDGIEATRRLKADPRTRHVPVLAITGHVEAHVSEAATAAGCDAFIVKPSPAPDVVQAIGRLIDGAVLARSRVVGGAAVRALRVTRLVDGAGGEVDDRVAVEEPLEVRVNNVPFAVIMRTPGQDVALAAGFLLAEDVVRAADEIAAIEQCDDIEDEARGNVLNVTVTGEAAARVAARLGERRQIITTAACGLCGRRTIESIRSRVSAVGGQWTVPAAVITRLPDALREAQAAFALTGGIHASALCDLDGRVRLAAEDVGRHNALDKIVGRALLDGRVPLDRALLVVSGRSSYELVQKALLAGVPLVAGVSAPSSLAVDLARATGITLCGFVRGTSMNVYTHPRRITR